MQCDYVKFQSFVYDRVQFAKQMATMVEFVDNKKSQELKKTFNHCIRLGQRFTEDNIIRIAKNIMLM